MIDNGHVKQPGPDFCPYCRDTGQVPAEFRREKVYGDPARESGLIEVMGPCQACTRGRWMEFPGPDKNGKPQVGAWGELGFWRGRKMEVEPESEGYLSREENVKRWRALGMSTGLFRE